MIILHTGILSLVVNVQFQRLDERAILPSYAHATDAGADLSCIEDVVLAPGERKLVRTGIAIALPSRYVGLIHPRSGLAHKHGVTIVNAPGTIDSSYRGEIMVNLINLDQREIFTTPAGSRIAQIVIQEFVTGNFIEVAELDQTERGNKGHGSTGVSQ